MGTTLAVSSLHDAIAHHAAFRRIGRLQPVGGAGDKIFPPTYPAARRGDPPRHVFERRRVDGREAWCVLIDSVQSQANRLEEALLGASEEGGLTLPYVTVDFRGTGLEPLERITSLDAPHRVYDAILRDSLLGEEPFMRSQEGLRLAAAKPSEATALLEISPTALLFGAWHSQGEGGGLGAKFPRALVSEIVAVDAPVDQVVTNQRTAETEPRTAAQRTGSRIDPLGVLRNVKIYRSRQDDKDWTPRENEAAQNPSGPILFSRKKGDKAGKPSVINHGNVTPSVEPLGVTCDYIEHRAVITLAGLRRLRFGDDIRNAAGRALIAALGLVALAEQDAGGYALRSRCDLVCDGQAPLELVRADGSTETIDLDREQARALYGELYAQALSIGFRFQSITLKPQAKLVEMVRRSRELALEGSGGEEDDGDS
jgi:CRISPR-associated protein Csb1